MSEASESRVDAVMSERAANLSTIYRQEVSLAVWSQREPGISASWLEETTALEWSVRERVDASASRAEAFLGHLPPGDARAAFIDDLRLLVGMFADLTGAFELGLRLETVDRDVCSAWHVDRVALRLISTYSGPATEWLAHEHVWSKPGTPLIISPSAMIQRLRPFDVGVFKGTAWDPPHRPVVHRSPRVPSGQRRLLLTIDPLE